MKSNTGVFVVFKTKCELKCQSSGNIRVCLFSLQRFFDELFDVITVKLCWWINSRVQKDIRTYKVDSILVTSCNKKRSTTNKKSSEYLSFLLSSPFIKHLVSFKCNDFLGNIIDIAHNPNCNSHPNRSSRVRKTKKFILNGLFASTEGALF